MALREPPFTLGIEEEYLLVDQETRAVADKAPEALFNACEKRLSGRVAHEFLSSQIEVNTNVCQNIGDARAQLTELRAAVSEIAEQFGLAPIAASTHPFSAGLWPGDTRFTTRFDETDPFSCLYAVMHETGHALYEQGLDHDHRFTPRGAAVSLGVQAAKRWKAPPSVTRVVVAAQLIMIVLYEKGRRNWRSGCS